MTNKWLSHSGTEVGGIDSTRPSSHLCLGSIPSVVQGWIFGYLRDNEKRSPTSAPSMVGGFFLSAWQDLNLREPTTLSTLYKNEGLHADEL